MRETGEGKEDDDGNLDNDFEMDSNDNSVMEWNPARICCYCWVFYVA